MANFSRLILVLFYRIICWCLVTSSLERTNLLIGLFISLLIPFGDFRKLKIYALIPELLLILRLPFDMIKESFQLLLIKDPVDDFQNEKINVRARNGSKLSEFFDLFRITFTPMSLVTRRDSSETWRVHVVTQVKNKENHQ